MENRKISYTGVVLTPESQAKLKQAFNIPDDWTVYCHHMTVNLGPSAKGPAPELLGQTVKLQAVAIGQDSKVMAVKIETSVPSINDIKHVTIAVNRNIGGKPFDSNKLERWENIDPIEIEGKIEEV